jgi:hypothetical protein
MKFEGYGLVWDTEKEKVLVDFESTISGPGVIEITDERTISILKKLGYAEYTDAENAESETQKRTQTNNPETETETQPQNEGYKPRGRKAGNR